MRKSASWMLIFAIFFCGCAGRQANPIPAYMPGDENRSCSALQAEIAQLQVDMARILPKTDKGASNALWAGAGVFTLGIGFLFMDFKDAEKVEFEAMRNRHNRLLVYAAEKGCDFGGVRAEKIPSLKERKKEAERILKQQETESKVQQGTKEISQKEYDQYQQYLADKQNDPTKNRGDEPEIISIEE